MGLIANVLIEESIDLYAHFPDADASLGETWAVSFFGETPSISVYSVTCNAWAVMEGALYGTGDAGIYALDSDDGTDNDVAFSSGVLIGPNTLGTELPKSIRQIRADGDGDISVGAGAGAYQTTMAPGTQQQGRHVFSRAVTGAEWCIGVEGFTELRGIEIQAAVLPRRRS